MSGIFDFWRQVDATGDQPATVNRLTGWWGRLRGRPADQGDTTETGTSATASPAVEQWELWNLRYNRRAIISDLRRAVEEDPRLGKALKRTAREAVRKGFHATVRKTAESGPAALRERRAQEVIDRTIKDCKLGPQRLRSWAWALPLEADLFIQRVVQGNQLVDAKRMPAASMERASDSQDRFLDVNRAFTQLDVQTDQNVATFALWQIVHARWNHLDGDRYGTSEFIQLRRIGRNLQLLEQAQVIRRIVRAALRLFHQVGNKEHPGVSGDVEAYKKTNSLAAQSSQGFDPTVAMRDYFGNGVTDIKPIQGDANLEKIDDLEYFQDIYASGFGPPKGLIFGGKDINRDVLKDQIEQWLRQDVQDLTEAIKDVLRELFDFALLLDGIDPETVSYDLAFTVNTVETAAERLGRITKARQNTLGSGKNAIADPLISRRVAVSELAQDYDVEDIDAMLAEIDDELENRGLKGDGPDAQPEPKAAQQADPDEDTSPDDSETGDEEDEDD